MVKHLDLFSGIGGFAYAMDQVWEGIEHVFCDNDLFCQRVLSKHWPNSKIYGDIREITEESLVANSNGGKPRGIPEVSRSQGSEIRFDIVTGGFPCQPFSVAGQRAGTTDDRHLWPEMFRVIQLTKPRWVIAENVLGILTIEGGLVFKQVCVDLESEGYVVQPLIIPACALNAPHRRDRVWLVCHSDGKRRQGRGGERARQPRESDREIGQERAAWDQDWAEVATRLCRMDDGVSAGVDRRKRLKALGNSIVPQVAIEIFRAITW